MDVLHIHNIRICDILLASAHQVFTPLLFPSLCLKLSSKHPLFGYDLIKVYICICLLNMIFFFAKKIGYTCAHHVLYWVRPWLR
jgi:hypothetical protein